MKVSIITPVYNEEKVINLFYNEVMIFFNENLSNHQLELMFIDDGSSDNSIHIINKLSEKDEQVRFVSFSRNFGKEAALFAGFEHVTGDVVVAMDVDLQDPLEVLPKMLDKIINGADVVLGKRVSREKDSFFKKISAKYFYKINNRLSSVNLEENVSDFRMLKKQVVQELIQLNENQLFMKGLMSWVGFDTEIITYERPERVAGDTKFNFRKLWSLAVEGITSFSTIPLKVWSYFGLVIALFSFIYGIKIIIEKVFFGIEVSGYASLMITVLFFGGVQLISIGVLGEYLGRTYLEAKRRPKYIVKRKK